MTKLKLMNLSIMIGLTIFMAISCAAEKVESIKLELEGVILPVRKTGAEGQIKALAFYKNNRMVLKPKFKYFSDNDRVAEVDSETGKFLIKGSGKAKLTAVMDGVSGEFELVVGIPSKIVLEAQNVTESEKDGKRKLFPKRKRDKEVLEKTVLTEKDSIEMKMGEKISMKAVVKDETGSVIEDLKIIWTASNYAFTVYQQVVEGAAIGTGKLVLTAGSVRTEVLVDVKDW